MSSSGYPTKYLGGCSPSTPFTEPSKYTCQPSYYAPSYTSSLPPGTYYWWMTYYKRDFSFQISGPYAFTVAAPTAPAGAALVSPADGAATLLPVTLTFHAPAGSHITFYVASSPTRASDGSPIGLDLGGCAGTAGSEGDYTCREDGELLLPGTTYYWWVVVDVSGDLWVYGTRSFTVRSATTGAGTGGPAGGTSTRDVTYAPYLPSSMRFVSASIKHKPLSQAAYQLSKILRLPKSIAVACWSDRDWPTVSGDAGDGVYTKLGFFMPAMPHWIQLSPRVCRSFETLLHNRPAYPNAITANAVETLTHEVMHALGVRNEARAECFGMQLSIILASNLKIPLRYRNGLARLTLGNYNRRPPSYIDRARCREDGEWDLFPRRNSPPWHELR